MKQNTYCLISQIPEEDSLGRLLSSSREKLGKEGILYKVPKLKGHITHVTPFQATPLEMCWFSLGLSIGAETFSHNGPARIARTTTFDFFEGKDGVSFIIRMEVDEDFRAMISRSRAIVQQLTNMVFPPESFQANFHATISEEIPIKQYRKKEDFWKRLCAEYTATIATHLQFPTIFSKENGYWAPVVI